MEPVLTKMDFVRRFQQGEFGNRGQTWNTLEEFDQTAKVEGLFHLRNRLAGGETFYNLRWIELVRKWEQVKDRSTWYASSMAPHDRNLIQGEVFRGTYGLELYYSTVVGKPMRDALALQSYQCYGVIADYLVKYYMDTPSHEWLEYLLSAYPDHVVEFSTFSRHWGVIPGMNSVFWEIRHITKGY